MRKFYKKFVLLVLFLALTLGCQSETVEEPETGPPIEFPDQEGWNSTLIITNEGIKSIQIEYGHMQEFAIRRMVYFNEGVQLFFYHKNGSLRSDLKADSAFLDESSNNMEAIGNVVVVQQDTTLLTNSLRWINDAKIIISNEPFMMVTGKQDTLFGERFEMNQATNSLRIFQTTGVSHEKLDFKGISRGGSKSAEKTPPDSNRVVQ
jgi:LPS export ABC transporter protein LptC